MQPKHLERYLHDHIPLSKAMAVRVVQVDDAESVLQAPLEPNINHRGTVFGGSASALAILAAWSLLHRRLHGEGLTCRLVIQRNEMAYDHPIPGAFTARARLAPGADWPAFLRMLKRKGLGRIAVTAVLEHEDQPVGRFTGSFVALEARAR